MNKTKLENWIERIEALPDLTREGLEALQLRRLNKILLRLKNRRGFYGNYPEKLEKLEDLSELPFTTPEMLASAPGKFLLTSQSEVSRIISGATSGTTGKSKRVFYTAGDTEHTVGFFAAGISEMLRPGEKCLIAFPFSGPFGLGDLIAQAVQRLGGVPVKAGFGQSWGELCALVRDTQPETFIRFPVHFLGLARMYGKSFPIRRALVSGDACPKGVMEELEKLLGSKLYPHYGSRECGLGGAVTCQAFHGMHLRENHIIAEIIDESGNVLPDGEYGELVITTIGMEAMPLIRYRTGDYPRILPPCQCGGVTKRLDTVSRRESLVSIEKLDDVLFRVPQLIDYRASYNADLLLEMRVNGIPLESDIRNSLKALYPHISFRLVIEKAASENCPMYSGKRHIIQTIT